MVRHTSNSQFLASPEADRRKVSRLQPMKNAAIVVWVSPEQQYAGEICDVAHDGIGVLVDGPGDFETSSQISIECQGTHLFATIVNVSETARGRVRIGLQWDESAVALLAPRPE